ncbi:hypothetical protein D3C86_1807120 [compost metagenome]
MDNGPLQIRQHRMDVPDAQIDANGIPRVPPEDQHHRLASAAGFACADFVQQALLHQLRHQGGYSRLGQPRGFGHLRPGQGRGLAQKLQNDGFIDFLHQVQIAGYFQKLLTSSSSRSGPLAGIITHYKG